MTGNDAEVRIGRLIRLTGRSQELIAQMVPALTRRERSRGVELADRLDSLIEEVADWVAACGDRMLQDQVNAET